MFESWRSENTNQQNKIETHIYNIASRSHRGKELMQFYKASIKQKMISHQTCIQLFKYLIYLLQWKTQNTLIAYRKIAVTPVR